MGLNDKLTDKETMSIFAGLALGAVIGGATCIRKNQEAYIPPEQTIEQSASNNSTSNNSNTIDYNSVVNRPFRHGENVLMCDRYDSHNQRLYFNSSQGRVFMNVSHFNAIRGDITYISMSTYRGYYPSSNVNMTSRPPAMYRYWNSINMAAGYRNNVNDASYIKNNENRLGSKVKNWIQKHKKNK